VLVRGKEGGCEHLKKESLGNIQLRAPDNCKEKERTPPGPHAGAVRISLNFRAMLVFMSTAPKMTGVAQGKMMMMIVVMKMK
jgi:hypothetical protein